MNGFQLLALIILGPACLWTLYVGARQNRPRQFLLTSVLGIALLLILHPNLATAVARFLGIGRGADLVTYFTALAVLGCYLLVFAFERRVRIQLTELTRAIAMMQLSAPANGELNSGGSSESAGLPRS